MSELLRNRRNPVPDTQHTTVWVTTATDTKHSKVIENKRYHKYFYVKANIPSQQKEDEAKSKDHEFVDLIFISHMKMNVLQALIIIGSNKYSDADVQSIIHT